MQNSLKNREAQCTVVLKYVCFVLQQINFINTCSGETTPILARSSDAKNSCQGIGFLQNDCQLQSPHPVSNILLVSDPEVLLELLKPDIGVLVRVKVLTVTLEANGESGGQLLGEVCLPCWVDRVGREELKIQ